MWRKKTKKIEENPENQEGFVINLTASSNKEEPFKDRGLFEHLFFYWRKIFSFFSRDKSINFIKNWEEEKGKKRKSDSKKPLYKFKIFSPFHLFKKGINFLPSFFLIKTFNTNKRGFLEAIFFLLKILFVNLKLAFSFLAYLGKILLIPFKVLKVFLFFFLALKKFFAGIFKNFSFSLKKGEKKKNKIEKQEEPSLVHFHQVPHFFLKSLLSFLAFVLLLIFIFKGFSYFNSLNVSELKKDVLGVSAEALTDFKEASGAFAQLDLNKAETHFSQANTKFLQAQKELKKINELILKLARFAPQKEIRLASFSQPVLEAGKAASRLGNNLSLALNSLLKINLEGENKKIIERIEKFEEYLAKTDNNTQKINRKLNQIDPEILPEQHRKNFQKLRKKTSELENFWEDLENLTKKTKIFLGEKQDRKYLLVFQNSAEMRATGGFIGSFALLEFSQGELANIEIPKGGSYDVDGGLNRLIAPPEPLQLVNDRWYFRDANWWPHWPTSAQKLTWFYENSGGPTVDGVISFTPEVLGSILEITGPLDMREKYGIIFTKDNFWENIRKTIEEEKKLEDNKPKKVINDLFHKIIEKIPQEINQKKLVNFLADTRGHLGSKNILFYFRQPELQEEVKKRSWGGRIKKTGKDYLSVINTNIAGGKSDKQIEQTIEHKAQVQKDGSIIDTLKIVREHTGASSQYYYGDRNVNWLRVYVPRGSELIEARGFQKPDEIYFETPGQDWEKDPLIKKEEDYSRVDPESDTRIYQENGKTVFANWVMSDPGEKKVIYFKYKLPFKIKKKEVKKDFWDKLRETIWEKNNKQLLPYSLLFQKQAGSKSVEFNSRLKLNPCFDLIQTFPKTTNNNKQGWNIKQNIDQDEFWAALLTKQEK